MHPPFLLHGVTVNHATYAENCDIYVEVKGQMNDADADKIKRFAEAGMQEDGMCGLSKTAVLVVGNIPWGETFYGLLDDIQSEAYNDHHTNMFDVPTVQYIANEMRLYELVIFLEEHRKEYVHFILTGECNPL